MSHTRLWFGDRVRVGKRRVTGTVELFGVVEGACWYEVLFDNGKRGVFDECDVDPEEPLLALAECREDVP